MKRLFIACGVLAALLGAILANSWYADRLTGAAVERLSQAQDMAEGGGWAMARALTEEVFAQWQSRGFYLHSTMRHTDTDQILRTFQEVRQYLQLEEMDQYVAANADLVTQIGLLGEMEQVSLANVL